LRGADVGSDHLLLGIWIRVKLKKLSKNKPINSRRFDIDKLEKQDIGKDFENNIKEALQSKQIMVDGNVDEGWE